MRLHPHHIKSRRALAIGVAVGLVTFGAPPMAAQAEVTPTCADITAAWGSESPVQIDAPDELYCIGAGVIDDGDPDTDDINTLELDFRLTAGISLSGFTGDTPWGPIGSSEFPFTGSFDGGGKTITGLNIQQPTDMELGLFGFIRDASITNFTLASPVVNGGDFVGSLVGEAIDSTITGVTATSVDVTANLLEATVGGLIGSITHTDVSNVTVDGTVRALADQTIDDDEGVGGVIGRIWDDTRSGRLAELAVVRDASFSGSVSGPSLVGGVIGHADTYPTDGTKWLQLTNLSSSGSVTSTEDFTEGDYPWSIGGAIGLVFDADLSDIQSTSTVTSKAPYSGGLVGHFQDSTLRDSHASGDVTVTLNPVGTLSNAVVEVECSAGGLLGAAYGPVNRVAITEVSASGDVSCMNGSFTGGLIGWADITSITSARASGDVTGSFNVENPKILGRNLGGLIGWAGQSGVSDVASTGAVTGWQSSDGPAPSASDAYYGGLIGYVNETSSIQRAYTTSSLTTDVDPEDPTIGSMLGESAADLLGPSFTSTDPDTLQIAGTLVADTPAARSSQNAQYRSLSDLGKLSTYDEWNSTSTVIVAGWVPSPRTTQVWGTCATVNSGLPFLQWQRTEACPAAPNSPSPSPDNGGTGGNSASDSGSSQSPSASGAGDSGSASQASSNNSLDTSTGTALTFRQPAAPQQVTRAVTLVPADVAAATPTRAMRQEASATLGSAPTVMATANQPVKLMVPGFTPGGTYTVQVKSNKGYVVLGSVQADANGQLQMPVFRMKGGSSTTKIAIVSTTGEASFVKVKTTKKKRGAGERNRTRGAAAGNRR